jgi:tetratricopeptide (TPR) repeat protein
MNHNLAEQLYYARRFDEAIEQCRKLLEMDPSFSVTYNLLGRVYLTKGLYREALAEIEKYAELNRGSFIASMLLAYAHARCAREARHSDCWTSLGPYQSSGTCLPITLPSSMPGWMRPTKPSPGSKRLMKSAPVFSRTLR